MKMGEMTLVLSVPNTTTDDDCEKISSETEMLMDQVEDFFNHRVEVLNRSKLPVAVRATVKR